MRNPQPALDGAALVERVAASEGEAVSPLGAVVVRAVQAAFAGSGGTGARELAGRAVSELVHLDAMRPGSWFALGLARGYGLGTEEGWPLPQTPDVAYFHLLGQATALVEQGQAARADAACEWALAQAGGGLSEHSGLHPLPGSR